MARKRKSVESINLQLDRIADALESRGQGKSARYYKAVDAAQRYINNIFRSKSYKKKDAKGETYEVERPYGNFTAPIADKRMYAPRTYMGLSKG